MKNIKEYIQEASINAKKRNIDLTKKIYMKGKSFDNIKCFAIITSENPDSTKNPDLINNKKLLNDFNKQLKLDHMSFIPVKGHYAGNVENSYIVFNIKLDVAKAYAGKYEQTSFFYCYPDEEGNLISEYYEKENKNKAYDKALNNYKFINKTTSWENIPAAKDNYTIIGHDFKYTIDPKVFEPINNKIQENLKNTSRDADDVMDFVINRVGAAAAYYRSLIND